MSSDSSHNSSIYIDLFDDGLYPLEAADDQCRLAQCPHVNALRIHVLLAILFERTVIVPEQWAISSATFLKVAFEVLEHFPVSHVTVATPLGPMVRRARFPFRVVFLSVRNDIRPSQAYAAAFVARAQGRSRIQLSTKLQDPDDLDVRFRVANAFLSCQSSTTVDHGAANQLRDQLIDVLGSEATAIWISSFYRHLSSHRNMVHEFATKRYEDELAVQAGAIARALGDRELRERDSRVVEFGEMIAKAQRDGMALHKLMNLWDLAKSCSQPARELITASGRRAMHRAMARTAGAAYSDASYGYYFFEPNVDALGPVPNPGSYDPPARSFFAKIREHEAELGRHDSEEDFPVQVEHESRFTQDDPWPEIWKSVWGLVASQAWQTNLAKLKEQSAASGVDGDAADVDEEPMARIFESLRGFHRLSLRGETGGDEVARIVVEAIGEAGVTRVSMPRDPVLKASKLLRMRRRRSKAAVRMDDSPGAMVQLANSARPNRGR